MKNSRRLCLPALAWTAACLVGGSTAAASTPAFHAAAAVSTAGVAQSRSKTFIEKDPERLRKLVRERAREMRSTLYATEMAPTKAEETGNNAPQLAANPLVPGAVVLAAADQQPAAPAPGAAPAAQPAGAPAAQQAPAADGPRLVFENPAHDFGNVHDTSPLPTKFKFTNKGNARLTINAVNTGCGCTASKLAKNDYEPGESGEIEITYTPKGGGRTQRSINVVSNDPVSPNTSITIAANVIPLLEARPQNIQFGQVTIGESRTVQLVLVSRDKDVKVTSVTSNNPAVEIVVRPDAKPQVLVEQELPGVVVADVILKDSAPVGRVMAQLDIKAMASKGEGHAADPQELKVFCFGQVQGEITLNPQQVRVAPTPPDTSFEREVIVTRRGNLDFKITGAEVVNANIPGITAAVEPWQNGDLKGFKVKISGKTGGVPGNFRGSVMLSTDVEREKNVEVQFSGIVRAAAPTAANPGAQPGQAVPANPTPTGTGTKAQ